MNRQIFSTDQIAGRLKSGLLPLATLLLVIFMVLPLPTILLDMGFITNIMISLAILMVALNASKPLDFSSFPTVLLFATLMRLGLNVASTRVVLVQGHEGGDSAGQIIEAFGSLLLGGNYVVGIFVFSILMIINLIVITKGAGRVSEVSARFTLDALPGKQMAIDADLNAGLIAPEEAKARRSEVATEADFYGSMDGASKFVKGDAVAGILILAVNIIGGIVLGTTMHDLPFAEAASTYSMLAIGDALVAQVPALILSIAAAAIVTRVSSSKNLPDQITSQFGSGAAWVPVAVILTILGILPGMPHLIILSAAAAAGGFAFYLIRKPKPVEAAPEPVQEKQPEQIDWEDVSEKARLGIEIGYGLVSMVEDRKGAPLMKRITGIRRQISKELGFVVPLVRIKDDLELEPNSYRIMMGGMVLGEDTVWPNDFLALDDGHVDTVIEGRPCQDPTFGMDALWIGADKKSQAIAEGYTVVDAPTVVATHLNDVVRRNAAQLFSMDEAQKLIDLLKETSPQLVDSLTPQPLSLFSITAICRELLAEKVPVKDFQQICLAMLEASSLHSETDQMVDAIRQKIGNLIVQTMVPVNLPLPVVTLDAELEGLLVKALKVGEDASYPIEPQLAQQLVEAVDETARTLPMEARNIALITSPIVRRPLGALLKNRFPDLTVLSYQELPEDKSIEVLAKIGVPRSSREIPQVAANPTL
ncbi:flagellar biosynthesis protein FlhA [Parasphingorhabdus litoris]|uniref:Flagellar biosynthesis protein FlhA n=1 Tax=Parasphingorhabdus litoris TaxID=394733 RepID=A0ABN1A3V2_9SPHN|nr:flagellar biosynthesis protein FlhA [Parasphingorhabdus litoris]